MHSHEKRKSYHDDDITVTRKIIMIGTILALITTAGISGSSTSIYSLLPTSVAVTTSDYYAFAKSYEKNQVMSQADACGNGELPLNILCQNIGSEIQGNSNAANVIGLQTGGNAPPPPVVEKATLNVIKQIICPEVFVCPTPDGFTISVTGINPNPASFPGSSTGTTVSLEPGAYEVTEVAPVPPTGLDLLPPVFSAGCTGDIQAGQALDCTITNEFVVQTATLNVIKKVMCPEAFTCPVPTDFTISVTGNHPDPITFQGSSTGTQVTLRPGEFQVSETAAPVPPKGLIANPPILTGCTENIQAGQALDCTITNEFVPSVILVPGLPIGIAYDPVNGMMYVTNLSGNVVYVIDTVSNTVVDTIPVGTDPYGIAYDPVHDRMYVANSAGHTVSVIDTASNTVVDTIPVDVPIGVAYDPVHERMYVTNFNDDTVSVIDTVSNTVVDTIPVGTDPRRIAYDPVHDRMYVANSAGHTVSVIDTASNTVVDTITVGFRSFGIAYDPVHERMYVTNNGDDTVSVIDTASNTVVDTITVGHGPTGIAHAPVKDRMYVTNFGNFGGTTVSVIDTTTNAVVGSPIPVSLGPIGIAYDPVHERMYVVNYVVGSVSVIDIATH